MKKISLTQGKFALVDDKDFDRINGWKWSLLQGRYAHRSAGKAGWLRMHRVVMDASAGDVVDHINGDGLDNRRRNLRLCTQQQNSLNRSHNKNSRSGHKDIFWDKSREKWFVQIMNQGKKYTVGRYGLLEEAIEARDEWLDKLHGEFAHV